MQKSVICHAFCHVLSVVWSYLYMVIIHVSTVSSSNQHLSTVEGVMCIDTCVNGVRGTECTLWEDASMPSPLYASLQHNKGDKLWFWGMWGCVQGTDCAILVRTGRSGVVSAVWTWWQSRWHLYTYSKHAHSVLWCRIAHMLALRPFCAP